MNEFKAAHLSEGEKESICRSLLAEFGVRDIRGNRQTGELVHACLVSDYHQDQAKNPTASLNYKKLTYNCLGCGSSGGFIWFIATVRGCTADQAYKWLEDEAGLGNEPMEQEKFLDIVRAIYAREGNHSEIIPTYSERVLEPWDVIHPYLTTVGPLGITIQGEPVMGRGLPEENLIAMRVGWNPDEDRCVIPHFWKGRLVGWQTRRMPWGGGPKYHSTEFFPKDQTIYNFDPTRRHKRIVVVESPMSCLMHLHRLPIVGTFGAQITNQQVSLLARADEVVLWLDPDKGGWSAMRGSANTPGVPQRLAAHTNVRVVVNTYDADPQEFPTEMAEELVDQAVPYVLWKQPDFLREPDWR